MKSNIISSISKLLRQAIRSKLALIVTILTFTACSITFYLTGGTVKASTETLTKDLDPIKIDVTKEDKTTDLYEKIANNSELQRNLATLAHYLGYGWCGKKDGNVGENMKVFRDDNGNKFIITSDKNDGEKGDTPLRITLSNFRMRIEPGKINFKTPTVEKLESPEYISTSKFVNNSNGNVDASAQITKQKWVQKMHQFQWGFTESLKIGQDIKVGLPLAESTLKYEFTFGSDQHWTDSETTNDTTAFSDTVKATVGSNSQKKINVITTPQKYSVDYDTDAQILFDVDFNGFFRYGGNARNYHPKDRPVDHFTFTGSSFGYIDGICDMYENSEKQEQPYWDMKWFKENTDGQAENIIKSACKPIMVHLDGTFVGIDGTDVHIEVGEDEPISDDSINTLD